MEQNECSIPEKTILFKPLTYDFYIKNLIVNVCNFRNHYDEMNVKRFHILIKRN